MLGHLQDQAPTARAAIRLDGVARRFGQRWVLRGIDLAVQHGEVVALTGRNGSGKTTILRLAGTLLRPTRGTVTVLGHNALKDGARIRGRVGLLGHNSGIYDDLTAAENLIFAERMSGRSTRREAIAGALEQVGLADATVERTRGFSAGMRRRLGLARLLLAPPDVLLLDEPYASFDDDGIEAVNAFVALTAQRGGVVLLTTHDMTRALDVVSRRVHIEDGLLADLDSRPGRGSVRTMQPAHMEVLP